MRLVIYVDTCGVEKVEIAYTGECERDQAHKLYLSLLNEIKSFDAATRKIMKAEGGDD